MILKLKLVCATNPCYFNFQSNEEGRKVACNVLLGIGSTLRTSSFATTDGPYHKLISMVMHYPLKYNLLISFTWYFYFHFKSWSADSNLIFPFAISFFRNKFRLSSFDNDACNVQITGYLSGSSPHIKSGAVSALSILVHNDSNICLLVPDLVPTVLVLLESKAIEVIKVSIHQRLS